MNIRARSTLLLASALALAGVHGVACGTPASDDGTGDFDASVSGGPSLGRGDASQALVISPADPHIDVSGPGVEVAFHAFASGASTPSVATWSSDAPAIGAVDANGVFTASGLVGGQVLVRATVGALSATTTLDVRLVLTGNPGNVDPGTRGALEGGGTADPALRWLYPYDRTVWPRGLSSPTLQLGGADPSAMLVHVSFASLDYKGFFGASSPARAALPASVWRAVTQSATATDAVVVEVTTMAGGKVTGPVRETWTIAQGSLRGTVYYNSYNSPLANGTGAVLGLRPFGGQTPSVVIPSNPNGECHVCHAVSANGSTLVASNERAVATPGFVTTDRVYELTNGAAGGFDAPNRTWDFGALSPDGARFLRAGAVPSGAIPGAPWAPNVRGLGESGDLPSALFDTKTGAPVASPGLDASGLHMMMPAFSPDGTRVAFNHHDTGAGHTIAIMDFDPKTSTFSHLRDVATVPGAYAGWPTFTPDARWLLFAAGSNVEYDTLSDDTSHVPEPVSDIWVVHVASGTAVPADALNGVRGGKVYLPFGEAAEGHLSFEPTILPVAAGGYYWTVFTTRREYGNTIDDASPYHGAAGEPSRRKKLWVSAVDIDPLAHPSTAARDVTHPAFYLEGQELEAGNMRGFWVLDPCKAQGSTCETGDECCGGFCRQVPGRDGGAPAACVPPDGCARESEKCDVAADCCDAARGQECLNGHCAQPAPR